MRGTARQKRDGQMASTRRPAVGAGAAGVHPLLRMQQAAGNRAAARFVGSRAVVQAKLTVGPVDDPLEREADRVAERFAARMGTGSPVEPGGAIPGVQRKCASCEEEEQVQRAPEAVQRKCAACEEEDEEPVQRLAEGGGAAEAAAGQAIESAVESHRGMGAPLDPGIRPALEGHLGRDLGGVRIHRDTAADELARSLSARAFTSRDDVFFRQGEYGPQTGAGRRLLAHELTHVVQQGRAPQRISRQDGPEAAAPTSVSLVRISCATRTVEFHTNAGVKTYTLSQCDLTDGDYDATVTVSGNDVRFGLGEQAAEGRRFLFHYDIQPGQPNPAAFFRTQRRVHIIAESLATGEQRVRFNVRVLTPEEFERQFGGRVADLPMNQVVQLPAGGAGNSTIPVLGGANTAVPDPFFQPRAAGGAALFAPSLVPNNSVGITWSEGHLSLFSRTNELLPFSPGLMRGYRGTLGMHGAESLPFLGEGFTEALIRGVPGRMRNDLLFGLLPGRTVIYRTVSAEEAAMLSEAISGTQIEGTYRYTPPRPESLGATGREALRFQRIFEGAGEPQIIVCGTNNCITAPEGLIEQVLGSRIEAPREGGSLDVMTGRTPEGFTDPFATGHARDMREYAGQPEAFFGERGLVRVTPGATRGMAVIRGAGGILLIYGAVQTARRLEAAAGTPEMPRVAGEEAGGWVLGTLGAALGSAGATAGTAALTGGVVCSPSGPLDLLCVAVGAVGGFVVGFFASMLGSSLGGSIGESLGSGSRGSAPCPSCHAMQRDWERQRQFQIPLLRPEPLPWTRGIGTQMSDEERRVLMEWLQGNPGTQTPTTPEQR